ncbi:tRNA 2-selenouridine(34) synthase MnmH [Rhodovulum sp. YNF3179]|uniref:tRNA 2-selenouridine(34) synthase MnmH n=1 Tax=Rhodovulum sp. YNF3179 TaxID=3425127 RepID=UPI003D354AFD
MALRLTALADLAALPFDEIIDVRSPSEYAEDHLPGAVNLPVLSDAERARVGTIYVQEDPFKARKIGAALVARNAAHHLETALAGKHGGYRPLVYCWRGGQRSGGFASILAQIGWRVELLDGGYRSYRRLVSEALYAQDFPAPVVLLDGNTGTAKTDILHALAARDVQVLDLEGRANHRGSLFGARTGGQPGQKAFESSLAMDIAALDPARPVIVEAESSRVGDRILPPALWKAMKAAPRITLSACLDERARYLARAYADLAGDPAALAETIERMRPMHAAATIAHWRGLAGSGAFETLARDLMAEHYDPRYAKHRRRMASPRETRVTLDDLSETGIARAAERLLPRIAALVAGR